MGFMDKVKSQASALAEKAQEGAKAGQEKLSQIQAKRQSDAMLLELGGIDYLTRTGRAPAGGDERVSQLVSQLQAFEADHGPVSVTAATPPAGETGSYVPGSSGAEAPVTGGDDGAGAGGGAAADSTPAPAGGGGIPTASYSSDEEAGSESN